MPIKIIYNFILKLLEHSISIFQFKKKTSRSRPKTKEVQKHGLVALRNYSILLRNSDMNKIVKQKIKT